MTVAELISLLEELDLPDAEVVVGVDAQRLDVTGAHYRTNSGSVVIDTEDIEE
jgi:hypothetical protein